MSRDPLLADEYEPTISLLREIWFFHGDDDRKHQAREKEFDQMLAAHDREVAARAWNEGYESAKDHDQARLSALLLGNTVPPKPKNPYQDQATQRTSDCATCGCDPRYPTAAHIVDCKTQEEGDEK